MSAFGTMSEVIIGETERQIVTTMNCFLENWESSIDYVSPNSVASAGPINT